MNVDAMESNPRMQHLMSIQQNSEMPPGKEFPGAGMSADGVDLSMRAQFMNFISGLSEEEKSHCLDVSEIVGTERW